MLTLYLRRNLSETAVPRNIVLRQWPDDGTRTETTTGRIFWRYEDEADMVPQYLATGVAGFETAVPFDSNGRNIRLYFIGRTELDTPNAQSFAEAEQKVVDMSGTQGVYSLFDHITPKATAGTSEETLHIYQVDAGQLSINGDKIQGVYHFSIANPANDKSVKLTLGGTEYDADITGDTGPGRLDFWFQRVSASVLAYGWQLSTAGSVYAPEDGTITSLDLDGTDDALQFKATTPDAAGDITLTPPTFGEFWPSATTNMNWWLDENGEPILDEGGDQIEAG